MLGWRRTPGVSTVHLRGRRAWLSPPMPNSSVRKPTARDAEMVLHGRFRKPLRHSRFVMKSNISPLRQRVRPLEAAVGDRILECDGHHAPGGRGSCRAAVTRPRRRSWSRASRLAGSSPIPDLLQDIENRSPIQADVRRSLAVPQRPPRFPSTPPSSRPPIPFALASTRRRGGKRQRLQPHRSRPGHSREERPSPPNRLFLMPPAS